MLHSTGFNTIIIRMRHNHTDVHLFIVMLFQPHVNHNYFFFSSGSDGPTDAAAGQQPATPLLILQSTPRHSTAGCAAGGGRAHRLLDATGRPRGNRSAADQSQVPRGCGAVSAAAAAPHPAVGGRRSGKNRGWRPPPINEYRRRYSCSEKLADEKKRREEI